MQYTLLLDEQVSQKGLPEKQAAAEKEKIEVNISTRFITKYIFLGGPKIAIPTP
jgi:hypothetical protein